MFKKIVTVSVLTASLCGSLATGAGAATVGRPGSYCKKADHGTTRTYTTPKGHKELVKCVSHNTKRGIKWTWKKA